MIKLQLANNLAQHFHSGQKYGCYDYFEYHLIGVVELLQEFSLAPVKDDMISVALLHDVLEDTYCTYETLENIFGFTVADAVSILTKIEGEPIEQYLFGVCSNHTARVVKFADSLFNYRECIKCGDLKRAEKYKSNLHVLHDRQTMISLDEILKYKPENVELVTTHNGGVEQDVEWFDESTCIQNTPPKKKKKDVKSSKSSRCKDTIDWVEEEYGDAYEKHYVNKKVKQSSQSFEQNISSTLVKQLTKSEIESLRQNKRDAYALMMKMN